MGSEMAYNLFSRKLVESHGATRFVVCDAREATSTAFAQNFTNQFPGARIEIANTPAEYVQSTFRVAPFRRLIVTRHCASIERF